MANTITNFRICSKGSRYTSSTKSFSSSTWHHQRFYQKSDRFSIILPNGRKIKNPWCLAAGYEKYGDTIQELSELDFGAIEIGGVTSVTEKDEKAKQRFNHHEKTVEIQEYGPKSGVLHVKSNLVSYHQKNHTLKNRILLGVNLNPSTESQDYTPHLAWSDFGYLARELFELSDYIVINLSNSKSAAIQQFRKEERLKSLLQSVIKDRDVELGMQAATEHQQALFDLDNKSAEERDNRQTTMFGEYQLTVMDCYQRTAPFKSITSPQIYIKIDGNRPSEDLKMIAKVSLETQIDGIIVGSCTENPSDNATSTAQFVAGNLKNEVAVKALKVISEVSKGKLTLMSSGGVWSGADALERMRAGASVVQIWTSFAMNGPFFVQKCLKDLEEEMDRQGIKRLNDIVGKSS